jgi:hypothetical protein
MSDPRVDIGAVIGRRRAHNEVRGCPGWFYGLLVRSHRDDNMPTVTFDVYRLETNETIVGLKASGYRTTTLARKMGERELRGYEHVAREAIKRSVTGAMET